MDIKLKDVPFITTAAFKSSNDYCLPGTRIGTLQAIQDWIEDPNAKPILWLHGFAGTGKSAVAGTVASHLENQTRLLGGKSTDDAFYGASFFFDQTAGPERREKSSVIPTVSRCLAEALPDLKHHIVKSIENDSGIATQSLERQWQKLIMTPLGELSRSLLSTVRLMIIIDALDECDDHAGAQTLLKLFKEAETTQQIQLRILVTSRGEKYIEQALEVSQNSHISIDLEKSRDDVNLYLKYELTRISNTRNFQDWPKSDDVRRLENKAEGLFIYAAAACRFLDDDYGEDRMVDVLEDETEGQAPQSKLDEIYSKVLTLSIKHRTRKERSNIHALFRNVVGSIIMLYEPFTVATLSSLLGLDKRDVTRLLSAFHGVIIVPAREEEPIRIIHLSFREYLIDRKRCSDEFWIDETTIHSDVFERCLNVMDSLHQDMCDLRLPGSLATEIAKDTIDQRISRSLYYSCIYFVDHLGSLDCIQRTAVGLSDHGKVHQFLLDKFLFWLETMSLVGAIDQSFNMVARMQALLQVSTTIEDHDKDSAKFAIGRC